MFTFMIKISNLLLVPVEEEPNSGMNNRWKVWQNKKPKNKARKQPIIGSKTDSASKVMAVEKLEWIFVSRPSKDCPKDYILDYLRMRM